jgi:hypothetical protein
MERKGKERKEKESKGKQRKEKKRKGNKNKKFKVKLRNLKKKCGNEKIWNFIGIFGSTTSCSTAGDCFILNASEMVGV